MLKNFFKKINSPWAVFILTAIFYGFFISLQLINNNYDFSRFVVAGDKFSDVKEVFPNLTVEKNSWGYDGQFYYRLALNPFTKNQTEYGVRLDLPALRQQRIAYPLVVWLLSFSQPALVPIFLLIVNYLALCTIGWLAGKVLQLFNVNALWGIFLSFYPGFLFTLSRDLTEILAVFFLLASLFFYKTNKYFFLSLALIFTVLTRETNFIFLIALFVASLYLYWSKKERNYKLVLYSSIAPVLVFLFWHFYLHSVWGTWPLFIDSHFNTYLIPLYGLISSLLIIKTINSFYWLEIGFLATLILISVYSLKFSKVDLVIKISWFFYFILFLSFSKNIWVEDWTFLRVVADLYLFSLLIILPTKRKINNLIYFYALFLWLRIFLRLT
ncbi:MAG: hypothetical protein WC675_03655 [Patescibacteria group bacterium]|jgi:hypothetical protein